MMLFSPKTLRERQQQKNDPLLTLKTSHRKKHFYKPYNLTSGVYYETFNIGIIQDKQRV